MSPGWSPRCRQSRRVSCPRRRSDRRSVAERTIRAGVGVAGRRRAAPDGGGARRGRLAVRHQRRRRPHLPVAHGLQRRTHRRRRNLRARGVAARTAATRRRGRPDRRHVVRRGMAPGNWRSSRWTADRRPIGSRCARPRRRCTSPSCGKVSGFGPDNLDPDRLPTLRAVLDRQCVHFHGAATDIPAETVRSLFSLDDWAADARRLTRRDARRARRRSGRRRRFHYQFALSITVVRHLQLDPLLPAELDPDGLAGTRSAQHLPSFRRGVQATRDSNNAFR